MSDTYHEYISFAFFIHPGNNISKEGQKYKNKTNKSVVDKYIMKGNRFEVGKANMPERTTEILSWLDDVLIISLK